MEESAELGAGVDEVWKLVGDFTGLIEAMGVPVESSGQGIGQTRKIPFGAEPTVERLEELDDQAHRVVYSIVEAPLPVRDYRSTMQLSPAGEGRTRLDWTGTFEVAPGASEEDTVGVVRAIYQGGIGFLQSRFGS
ncbi:MAG TPA: SRPBCC family protein [Acidimicrobiales bacterium]|nr:SRPBCC family protein [Acidimicrobiales bacterium]